MTGDSASALQDRPAGPGLARLDERIPPTDRFGTCHRCAGRLSERAAVMCETPTCDWCAQTIERSRLGVCEEDYGP